jgi:nicotinamidase-related amidase
MSDPSSVPGLLDPRATALLVVDVQTRFAAAIPDFEGLAERCARLARTFRLLDLPIVTTEQYPAGLGATVPTLRRELEDAEIFSKTAFSSFGCEPARAELTRDHITSVLVCGLETHVCVSQGVHEMLAAGLRVHVARDAVASRRDSDRDTALERLRAAGAVITTSEAAAFELMRDATHPAFKQVQRLYL